MGKDFVRKPVGPIPRIVVGFLVLCLVINMDRLTITTTAGWSMNLEKVFVAPKAGGKVTPRLAEVISLPRSLGETRQNETPLVGSVREPTPKALPSDEPTSKKTEALPAVVGADVKAPASWVHAQLFLAARKGNVGMMKSLLRRGVNINVMDLDGNMLLHHAARIGHVKLMTILLDAGADVNCQIGACAQVNCEDHEGETPLHVAGRTGSSEVIKLLLDRGAHVNALDKGGTTPLHWAAYMGQLGTVKILLEAGADVNIRNHGGTSALMMAMMRHRLAPAFFGGRHVKEIPMDRVVGITKLLLAAGADLKPMDSTGRTALHWAARHGYTEAVKVLLAAGADPDARFRSPRTGDFGPSVWSEAKGLSEDFEDVETGCTWRRNPGTEIMEILEEYWARS